MQLGFFISGVAGQMAQGKLDNISNNLANANTTGFLEDRVAFSSLMSNKMGRNGTPDQTSSAFLSMNRQYVSTQAGSIRHTGNDYDFAIRGDDQSGSPIKLTTGAVSATENGTIYVNGQPAADLGVTMLKDERQIHKVAGVLITTPASNLAKPDKTISVLQGRR